ncbi:MAG: hypothetical protein B6243_09330 [Anaerolineaceae bacterium 4572_5.2]|nr:MAG: hypothetical protein B6243_09330 [Anaerolineaceae bacterium 4572_5.2]
MNMSNQNDPTSESKAPDLLDRMRNMTSSTKEGASPPKNDDLLASIPKAPLQTDEEPTSKSTPSAPRFKKKEIASGGRSLWENSLRALWTLASVISMLVNIVVVALLIALYQNMTVVEIPERMQGIDINVANDLLKGLYDNFELMDNAHIKKDVPVDDSITVDFDLELNQETNVVLSDDVTIAGAYVSIDTALFDINAPATVVLPSGTSLPIILNLTVPVNETVPVKLNVSVDIPLDETELHQPFVGLQDVVQPLYCLVSPNATSLGGEAICP